MDNKLEQKEIISMDEIHKMLGELYFQIKMMQKQLSQSKVIKLKSVSGEIDDNSI